jgi:hypothetical protein
MILVDMDVHAITDPWAAVDIGSPVGP